jgi:hypothetical protein
VSTTIGRVQRVAGELDQSVRGVKGNVADLLKQLQQIDPHVASAIRSLEGLRPYMRSGMATREQVQSYHEMTRYVEQQAPTRLAQAASPEAAAMSARLKQYARTLATQSVTAATGSGPIERTSRVAGRDLSHVREDMLRAELAAMERADDAGAYKGAPRVAVARTRERMNQLRSELERRQAGVAPEQSQALPKASRARPLIASEVEDWRGRGYSDAGRARLLREGTLIFDQPESTPRAAAAGAVAPSMRVERQPRETTSDRATAKQAAAEETRAYTEQADAEARSNFQHRAQKMENRDLQKAWKESSATLRSLSSDLDGASKQHERLSTRQRLGIELTQLQQHDYETLSTRLTDLNGAMRSSQMEQSSLATEAERRGGRIDGGAMLLAGGRGGSRGLNAMLAGGGLGGGGLTGGVVGAIAGRLTPLEAWYASAGYLGARAIRYGAQSYGARVEMMRSAIPMAIGTRDNTESIIDRSTAAARQFPLYTPREILAAEERLTRATGQGGVARGVLEVALLSGQSPEDQAAIQAALLRRGRRIRDPRMSLRMMEMFRRTRIREPIFLPQFEEAAMRTIQGTPTPFSRIDPEMAAAQLASVMETVPMPGVTSPSARMDIGVDLIAARNQYLSGMFRGGGVFADLSYYGVRRLQGNRDVEERLRRSGIDIRTPLGVAEAIERAPELAAISDPKRRVIEVQAAMDRAVRDFLPDESYRGMALYNQTGNAQFSRLLASGKIGEAVEHARPSRLDMRIKRAPRVASDKQRARAAIAAADAGDMDRASELAYGMGESTTGPPETIASRIRQEAIDRAAGTDVQDYGQKMTVPEIQAVEFGRAVGDTIAPVIQQGLNDMKQGLLDELSKMLSAEVPGSPPDHGQ